MEAAPEVWLCGLVLFQRMLLCYLMPLFYALKQVVISNQKPKVEIEVEPVVAALNVAPVAAVVPLVKPLAEPLAMVVEGYGVEEGMDNPVLILNGASYIMSNVSHLALRLILLLLLCCCRCCHHVDIVATFHFLTLCMSLYCICTSHATDIWGLCVAHCTLGKTVFSKLFCCP